MYKILQILVASLFRTFILFVVATIGIFSYRAIEDVNTKTAAYFIWSLLTTIGYGTEIPRSDGGKLFTIFYGLFGIPVLIFAIASYGSLTNHIIKKLVCAIEVVVCSNKRVKYIYIKLLCFLIISFLTQVFLWGYVTSLLEDISVIDAMYAWFATLSTVGFGDIALAYPIDKSYRNFALTVFMFVVTSTTIASIIEAVQGIVQSIDNNNRGICAVLCCCFKNDTEDHYEIGYEEERYAIYQAKS